MKYGYSWPDHLKKPLLIYSSPAHLLYSKKAKEKNAVIATENKRKITCNLSDYSLVLGSFLQLTVNCLVNLTFLLPNKNNILLFTRNWFVSKAILRRNRSTC